MTADPWARMAAPGIHAAEFLVPDIHCAGCIGKIERGLSAMPGVLEARVNLSTKRLSVRWEEGRFRSEELTQAVKTLGFDAKPFDPQAPSDNEARKRERELLVAMGVAGFAAANVMLLSVSVWSGAEDATRALFHWISALIALPAVVFSGKPFFRSALSALRARRLNMDVPISLAVILASAMSLFETISGGHETYFDAAVMLLFFLLVGRYLDRRMRGLAQSGASRLMTLAGDAACVVSADGQEQKLPLREIVKGMRIRVRPGERIPADGMVLSGRSEIGRALITGETLPQVIQEQDKVHAGTDNLTGLLEIEVTATGEGTLLAEIVRLAEAAEKGKGTYVRLADRAAQIYAPAVHGLAALAFAGWFISTGDWHLSLTIAIATLIITCPCALGLAVPAVQIVAANRLLERGVMMKDGAALEKLAGIDTVAFDKTGTLTQGTPELTTVTLSAGQMAIAYALAQASRHPLCQAIVAAARANGTEPAKVADIVEKPGFGVEGSFNGERVALGRPEFAGYRGAIDTDCPAAFFKPAQQDALCLQFRDHLREHAPSTIAQLRDNGLAIVMMTGDRLEAAQAVARKLGLEQIRAGLEPQDKLDILNGLRARGRMVLMVGDGLNDTPALAAAHVSMSPASAADISRNAAQFVYMGESLAPIAEAYATARAARRLIMQNFALAAGYNAIAVPLAITGHASPLLAAVAMSASSILVTANALRLNWPAGRSLEPEAGVSGLKEAMA